MAEYLAENSRLRQLSRRHAEGQLASHEYRAQRRDILQALEEGRSQSAALPAEAVETQMVQPAPGPLRQPDDTAVFYKTMPPQVDMARPQAPTAAAATEGVTWDSHTRLLALILGLAFLLALLALIYVFLL